MVTIISTDLDGRSQKKKLISLRPFASACQPIGKSGSGPDTDRWNNERPL